jgi:hypothetical protein
LSIASVSARAEGAGKPKTTANSIGMTLAIIPAGDFPMGHRHLSQVAKMTSSTTACGSPNAMPCKLAGLS